MKQSNGSTIKFIRESLAYSQAYVAEGIMTQSSYSKAERGEIELTFPKMEMVLKKFGMTMDEFLYIRNGYSMVDDSGLEELRKINFVDEKSLLQLLDKLKKMPHPSQRTQEYIIICEALLLIARDEDYEGAKEKVETVWKSMEKHDTWFMTDIFLLSTILFIFPIDTAVLITERVLRQLQLYRDLPTTQAFAANISSNLITLLLQAGRYKEGYAKNEEFIAECKRTWKFSYLALAYARKGIFLNKMGEEGEEACYKKCFTILSFVDLQNLEEQIRTEIHDYTGLSL